MEGVRLHRFGGVVRKLLEMSFGKKATKIMNWLTLIPQILPLLPDIEKAAATIQRLENDPDVKQAIATEQKLQAILAAAQTSQAQG